MNVLMIDTATEACSAALAVAVDPQRYQTDDSYRAAYQVREVWQHAPRQHAELILGMLQDLLQSADLTAGDLNLIAFTTGSGSFIGVRTAAAVAQGLSYAAAVPIVAIPTLQILAQQLAYKPGISQVLVAWDARMGEVYAGLYKLQQHGVMQPILPDELLDPAAEKLSRRVLVQQAAVDFNALIGAGNAWQLYPEQLPAISLYPENASLYPHAADCLPLALHAYALGQCHAAVSHAYPHYLRQNVARRPGP